MRVASAWWAGAAMLAAVLAVSSCGGSSSPSPGEPSGGAPAVPAGATRVTGSERLAWQQPGGTGPLRFLGYVDGNAVWLESAQCNDAAPDAECSSPLPPMADGTHTLAVAAFATESGLEGDRSETITVYKVSARSVVSASSLPAVRVAGAGLVQTFTTADGSRVAADVAARGLSPFAQAAALPDDRVLIADTGRILMVRPGRDDTAEVALDVGSLASPPPIGSMGIAADPDFARSRFVFVAFLAREDAALRLRIVRLREAGDRLGEAATIFEAPVSSAAHQHDMTAGPLAAFGPGGLLHVLLPSGRTLDDPRLASQPHGAMLRIDSQGRLPDAGPVQGLTSHPLGFGWHGSAGARMLGLVAGGPDRVELRVMDDTSAAGLASYPALMASLDPRSGIVTPPAPSSGALGMVQRLAGAYDPGAIGTFRLAAPVRIDGWLAGLSATVHDVTSGPNGTHFLVLQDDSVEPGAGERTALLVRIRAID